MASNPPPTRAEMEKIALIMTTIILDFNFPNGAHDYSSEELSELEFQCASPVQTEDIQLSLNTMSLRNSLSISYGVTFTSHKDKGTTPNVPGQTRWKIKNPVGFNDHYIELYNGGLPTNTTINPEDIARK
jgi:hypothetical protein